MFTRNYFYLILLALLIPICANAAFIINSFGTFGAGGPPASSYEDFTSYTEVDPNTAITIDSETKLSWVAISSRDTDAYVYADKGAAHFNVDFQHQFEVYITSITSNPVLTSWAVASNIDDSSHFVDGIGLAYAYADNQWLIILTENSTESNTSSGASSWSVGTLYYVTMTLDWDGGTNSTGLVTAEIRTTSHTNETGKITITKDRAVGEQNSYQYLYAMSTWDSGDSGHTTTGYVQNLDIGE